jgi:hypothetical protein
MLFPAKQSCGANRLITSNRTEVKHSRIKRSGGSNEVKARVEAPMIW